MRALERVPHPMALVHTQGTLPHQGIYDESQEARRDWGAALDLALAARLTGEARLEAKAVALIGAWLPVYRLSFNPIDETMLDRFCIAFDLLTPAERSPIAEDFNRFAHAMAAGYLDHMPAIEGGKRASFTIGWNAWLLGRRKTTNNWQSHRIKLATIAAFASGDRALIERAKQAYVIQLDLNIMPDGSVADFAQRDSLHYVTYDLEPLLMTALAAHAHGEAWYEKKNPAGVGLKDALRWLAPYAEGTKRHEEFARSSLEFDRERAAAAVDGSGGAWAPQSAQYVYAMAARLDPDFAALSGKLLPGVAGDTGPTAPWLQLSMPI